MSEQNRMLDGSVMTWTRRAKSAGALFALALAGCGGPMSGSDLSNVDQALSQAATDNSSQAPDTKADDTSTARQINATPIDGDARMNWTYTIAGASATDMSSHSFRWDFGDGSRSGGTTVQHLFRSPGVYHVTVQALTPTGITSFSLADVTSAGLAETQFSAWFSVTVNAEANSLSCDAETSLLQAGETVSYAWQFSDGGSGSGPSLEHLISGSPDAVTVTLVAQTSAGRSSSYSQTISLAPSSDGALPSDPNQGSDTAQSASRIRIYWDYHGWATEQRGDGPADQVANPQLEGVIIATRWNTTEPQPGVFDFSGLDAEVAWWAERGKKVILRSAISGSTDAGPVTPEWIYEQGVSRIEFYAADTDTELTSIPRSWDSDLFQSYLQEFVSALGQHYDGDPRISYIWIGPGHLGETTANASSGGNAALQAVGWTRDAWNAYILKVIDMYTASFQQSTLYLSGSPLWTRSSVGQAIGQRMHDVADYALAGGASIQFKGMDPDPNIVNLTPLPNMIDAMQEALDAGQAPANFTLLLGDDWPMWADAERRAIDPQVDNRDNAGFASSLLQALQFWDQLGRKPDLIMVLLDPEMTATSPASAGYDASVATILDSFLGGDNAALQQAAGAWVAQ